FASLSPFLLISEPKLRGKSYLLLLKFCSQDRQGKVVSFKIRIRISSASLTSTRKPKINLTTLIGKEKKRRHWMAMPTGVNVSVGNCCRKT
ncbi:hypothetical protein DVH24_001054, partial [Malus domestica]